MTAPGTCLPTNRPGPGSGGIALATAQPGSSGDPAATTLDGHAASHEVGGQHRKAGFGMVTAGTTIHSDKRKAQALATDRARVRR